MKYRILGKTGLSVCSMGFGGIPIQRIDEKGTALLLRHLMELGVNYIDTARGYTVSECYIGQALEGIRDRFILATKSMARTRAAMAADIEISLQNLRTDHIDLYQIHNPSLSELETVLAPGGALDALLEAKAAGKIHHIGLTCHALEVFEKATELPWVETIMFPYNIVETQGQALIHRCKERNIGFIAMKPLAGGAIDDASLALRFLATNDDVTLTIPGMASIDEADQNFAAMGNTAPLTSQELAAMDTIRQALGTHFCRRCNYCAPCSAGISIPNVFLMEGYLSRYGLADWARSRYFAMPKTAIDCIGCGDCENRCPYQLPIRDMMRTAAVKFGQSST